MVKWMKQPDFTSFSLSWTMSRNPPWMPQKNVVSDSWNEGNWTNNATLKENLDPIPIRTKWIGRLELYSLRYLSAKFGNELDQFRLGSEFASVLVRILEPRTLVCFYIFFTIAAEVVKRRTDTWVSNLCDASTNESRQFDNLSSQEPLLVIVIKKNKLISVFNASVLLLTMNFVLSLSK